MKNTLFHIISLGLLWLAPPALAKEAPALLEPSAIPSIETVSINGLIAGKAVVKIGGRHHIMRIGQKFGNVKLVSADQYSAVLSVDGQEKRFYLQEAKLEDYSDDFIAKSSELSDEQTEIMSSNTLAQAKSHIIKVELKERLDDRARFRVEYFYNASHGKLALLRARTFNQGRATGYSAHSHTQLEAGRNLVDIVLTMGSKSPNTYSSDSVKFEITGEKNIQGSHTVLAKYIPFEKVWLREAAEQPKTLLGNATWQTGSR